MPAILVVTKRTDPVTCKCTFLLLLEAVHVERRQPLKWASIPLLLLIVDIGSSCCGSGVFRARDSLSDLSHTFYIILDYA
jgi:hypothetical protein